MKKYIWINFLLILCTFSCVNRSVDKSKVSSDLTEKKKGTESVVSAENVNTTESKISLSESIEKTAISEQKETSGSEQTEAGTSKAQTENSSRKVTNRKYYPNGTLKSETETSENNSKAIDEKNYYKSIFEEQKKENTSLQSENTNLKQEKSDFTKREGRYKADIKNYEALLKKKDLQLAKNSEKKIPFATVVLGYAAVIVFIITLATLLYFVWKWLKNSQWYLKIFNIKSKL